MPADSWIYVQILALRAQNRSMKEGVRRCTSCNYRIDYKNRQGQAPYRKFQQRLQ